MDWVKSPTQQGHHNKAENVCNLYSSQHAKTVETTNIKTGVEFMTCLNTGLANRRQLVGN